MPRRLVQQWIRYGRLPVAAGVLMFAVQAFAVDLGSPDGSNSSRIEVGDDLLFAAIPNLDGASGRENLGTILTGIGFSGCTVLGTQTALCLSAGMETPPPLITGGVSQLIYSNATQHNFSPYLFSTNMCGAGTAALMFKSVDTTFSRFQLHRAPWAVPQNRTLVQSCNAALASNLGDLNGDGLDEILFGDNPQPRIRPGMAGLCGVAFGCNGLGWCESIGRYYSAMSSRRMSAGSYEQQFDRQSYAGSVNLWVAYLQ